MMLSIILIGLGVVVVFLGASCFFIWFYSRGALSLDEAKDEKFDVITFHSYKPPKGEIPERGKLVAAAAVELLYSSCFRCPLMLSVGYTVAGERRMESEIYADYIKENLVKLAQIITARDGAVRDTDSEVKSCFDYCLSRGFYRVCVIGARPHLGSRIIRYWKKANRDNHLKVSFVAVRVPFRYYLWEAGMMWADFLLPPSSKRRKLVLDIIGRRK